MDEIEELKARIDALEDLVLSLRVSVQYSDEEPYLAELVRRGIAGEQRREVTATIAAVLGRARGVGVQSSGLRPSVVAALSGGPAPNRAQAVAILAEVVGDAVGAEALLDAHRARGLGAAGHAALGD